MLHEERAIVLRVLDVVRSIELDNGHGLSKRRVLAAIKEEFGLGGYEYCSGCREWLLKSEFWRQRRNRGRGLQSYCKVCKELQMLETETRQSEAA